MIVNFYKTSGYNSRNDTLIASKNIECVPFKGTYIKFSGQFFVVEKVWFDIDKCVYNVYIVRV